MLEGANNSIAGTVSGSGYLELYGGGTTTIAAGAALTVAEIYQDATLALSANLSYAGNFFNVGQLVLNGKTATLKGVASLGGGVGTTGVLMLAGAETLDGLSVGGSVSIDITATTSLRGATMTLGNAVGATANINVMAGGTLRLADDNGIATSSATSKIVLSGTLLKTGFTGESHIAANVSDYSTAVPIGTITVAQGTLGLDGASTAIGGLVNGAGTLAFDGASTNVTFKTGTTLNVGGVLLSEANLTLASSLSYAGTWEQTGSSTLDLPKGGGLTLTGAAIFEGGEVFGTGTISASSALLGGSFALDAGAQLDLTGASLLYGAMYLGNLADAAPALNVAAGSSFTLDGGSAVYGGAGAGTLNVAGALVSVGSFFTNDIETNATSTGGINLVSGVLDFTTASTASLSGVISGAGTLQIDGTATLAAGSTLSAAQVTVTGTLDVLGSESYAGTFDLGISSDYYGTTTLSVAGGTTLTLGGPFNFLGELTGGGVVATTGTVNVNSSYYPYYYGYYAAIDGGTTLSVAGVAQQIGGLYVGLNSGSTGVLDVLAGGTWTDDGGPILVGGGATGTIENAGTFVFDGGDSASLVTIAPNVINTGTAEFLNAYLTLTGPIGGGGGVQLTDSYVEANGQVLGGATWTIGPDSALQMTGTLFDPAATVAFASPSALLQVEGGGTFSIAAAGFATGNEIDLAGFSFANAAPLAYSSTTGVLTVSDGSVGDMASIHVGTGLALKDFSQQTDGNTGGIAIFHV